ncbi:MAG: DoxX family membrane protein [bacterium]|nr:DoxX family membrane protein [bacterium]
MLSRFTGPSAAALLLRLGLGAVLLIFGYGKIADTVSWLGFVPPWMIGLLPMDPVQFLRVVGVAEVLLGVLLVVGWRVRIVAAVVALHLLTILAAVARGDLAVRDFGLFMAAAALGVLGDTRNNTRVDD